jgi:hypothetical protein
MVYTIVVHLYAKDDKESISKLKAKLVEASQVYSKDKETLSWFVMQDVSDERKFTIVERYLKESVCTFLSFMSICLGVVWVFRFCPWRLFCWDQGRRVLFNSAHWLPSIDDEVAAFFRIGQILSVMSRLWTLSLC